MSTFTPTPSTLSSLVPLRLVAASDAIDSPCVAYQRMAERWALISALLGGTRTMRECGVTYLPKEQGEQEGQYNARLQRSFLYEAFSNTIKTLGSKPFSRPVTVTDVDKFPPALQWMFADVDYSGCDFTQFARKLFDDLIAFGKTHVLVDYPKVTAKRTLEDEQRRRLHPVLVHVAATDLIGWKSVRSSAGVEELTEVRIRETCTDSVGTYGQCEREAIRTYTKTTWQLHVRMPKENAPEEAEWILRASGTHTLGRVPLVPIYAESQGFMHGSPPLEDLAWLNLAHWQSMSDQRNILRFARTGLLFVKGVSEEQVEEGLAVGPTSMLLVSNPEADAKYVEHTGASIAAGRQDLLDLEARMEVLGLQPLTQRTGGVTATGRAIDEQRSHSLLQAWIRALEDGLTVVVSIAAQWIQAARQLPAPWAVEIFSDFGISTRARDDMLLLLQMRMKNQITHELFLREMRRRALISDDVDIDAEIAATAEEAAAAAALEAQGEVTGSIGDLNSGAHSRRSGGRKKRMKGTGVADKGLSGGNVPGSLQGRGGIAGGSTGTAGA